MNQLNLKFHAEIIRQTQAEKYILKRQKITMSLKAMIVGENGGKYVIKDIMGSILKIGLDNILEYCIKVKFIEVDHCTIEM